MICFLITHRSPAIQARRRPLSITTDDLAAWEVQLPLEVVVGEDVEGSSRVEAEMQTRVGVDGCRDDRLPQQIDDLRHRAIGVAPSVLTQRP